jgi:hypothetical protein
MLTSFMGAAVPHSAPSRSGGSGMATAWIDFRSALQRAWAASISGRDQLVTGAASSSAGPRRRRGQALASPGVAAGRSADVWGSVGFAVCAHALVDASKQTAAAAERPLRLIKMIRPSSQVQGPFIQRPHSNGAWRMLTCYC